MTQKQAPSCTGISSNASMKPCRRLGHLREGVLGTMLCIGVVFPHVV